jgi:uncharacterized membrane protein
MVVLLAVSVLPFPTRLVAEGIHDSSDERLFVAMCGLTLLAIRVLLFALDDYCRREHLYARIASEEDEEASPGNALLPVVAGYVVAILVGIALPAVAVALYCVLALYLVVPFRELGRVLLTRT